MKDIFIENRKISKSSSCFIIAELSANHGNDIEIAKETIRAAKRCGADAIKLQTYTADTMTLDSNKTDFIVKGTIWEGRNLYKLYEEAALPWDWHEELFEIAKEEGIICFSSPFDKTAVDLLEKLNTPAYKIASFEITDIPLIEYAASKGKPMIISTGIADKDDIQLAVDTCRNAGNNDVILLKTTSQYPAKIEDANLVMIPKIAKDFNVITGLSDHTLGITVPVSAIILGAKVIEKHFILKKSVGGVDSSFSLDEKEFTEMVNAVRQAEKSIGKIDYSLSEKAKKMRIYARSLYVVEDIKKGEKITKNNIRSIRPSYGLAPKYYEGVLGKKAKIDLKKATPLNWEQLI